MVKISGQSKQFLDILFQILLNLRIQELSTFKCVCKSWLSLISSSCFQEQHYNCQINQNPILLITEVACQNLFRFTSDLLFTICDNNEKRMFRKTVPYTWGLLSQQSCRGVVCLWSKSNFFLLNPSTEELILLPQVSRKNQYCFGLGFAPLSKEFKVVLFSQDSHGATYCEVYTPGTNYWREVKYPPPFADMGVCPFVDGNFYLLPRHLQDNNISALNIETEEYREIRFPECCNHSWNKHSEKKIYLKELGGSLCLTVLFKSWMEIWFLMVDHNEWWKKKYTIKTSLLVKFSLNYETYPLKIMRDGSIILNISGMSPTMLLRYDPKQKVTKIISVNYFNSVAVYFDESFFPLENR